MILNEKDIESEYDVNTEIIRSWKIDEIYDKLNMRNSI